MKTHFNTISQTLRAYIHKVPWGAMHLVWVHSCPLEKHPP